MRNNDDDVTIDQIMKKIKGKGKKQKVDKEITNKIQGKFKIDHYDKKAGLKLKLNNITSPSRSNLLSCKSVDNIQIDDLASNKEAEADQTQKNDQFRKLLKDTLHYKRCNIDIEKKLLSNKLLENDFNSLEPKSIAPKINDETFIKFKQKEEFISVLTENLNEEMSEIRDIDTKIQSIKSWKEEKNSQNPNIRRSVSFFDDDPAYSPKSSIKKRNTLFRKSSTEAKVEYVEEKVELADLLKNEFEDKQIENIALTTFNQISKSLVGSDVTIEKAQIEDPDAKVDHKIHLIHPKLDNQINDFEFNISSKSQSQNSQNELTRFSKDSKIKIKLNKKMAKDFTKLDPNDIKKIVRDKLQCIAEILEAIQHSIQAPMTDQYLRGQLDALIEVQFELKRYSSMDMEQYKYVQLYLKKLKIVCKILINTILDMIYKPIILKNDGEKVFNRLTLLEQIRDGQENLGFTSNYNSN